MILLKLMRTRTVLFGGSNSITDKQAEMILDQEGELVLIKQKTKPYTEYLVPLNGVEHMQPAKPMEEGVFGFAPPAEAKPTLNQLFGEPRRTPPLPDRTGDAETIATVAKDEIRFVKIDGRIVERKGEPKADELKALEDAAVEAAERLVAAAEEEPTEENTRPKPMPPTPPSARKNGKRPTTVKEMLDDGEDE